MFERIGVVLQERWRTLGELDLHEGYIDGTHVPAKRGVFVVRTRGGQNTKVMAVTDRHGTSVAATIARGERHETQLVAQTLRSRFASEPPTLLIGDRAYDSDPLDEALLRSGVELVTPHTRGRKKKTQDGRRLTMRIERCFAWRSGRTLRASGLGNGMTGVFQWLKHNQVPSFNSRVA